MGSVRQDFPRREDGHTRRRLQYLPAGDFRRLIWLAGAFVKRLCGSSGLYNPIEDARSVYTDDTRPSSAPTANRDDGDIGDESLSGMDSCDANFLRCVKFVEIDFILHADSRWSFAPIADSAFRNYESSPFPWLFWCSVSYCLRTTFGWISCASMWV